MISWVPRIAIRLALVAAAVSATVPAAGCAGNAASAKETASERAQARTFAAGVNLTSADLPGFKVVIEDEEGRPGPLDGPVEQCDGGPVADKADRGVSSPLFQTQKEPVQTVISEVYRMRSAAIASRYLRAADADRGLRCIERGEVRKRASLSPGARGKIEVTALRRPLDGAGVSGIRVWRCLAIPQPCAGSSAPSFTDRLWFATGPYVVALFYIAGARNEAQGPQPLALPLERRLIALLHTRTQSRKP